MGCSGAIPLRGIWLALSSLLLACAGAAASRPANPVDEVDPFIGTVTSHPSSPAHGLGKTIPGPCTPFGLVQLGPDTITGGDNGSGYSYTHSTIEGFSFTHLSGVGWYGDFGNLQVMPQVDELILERDAAKSPFQKAGEKAAAGYYAVRLDRGGIDVELTAAPHAGMLRCTFPAGKAPRFKVDLARRIGGRSTQQFVRRVDERSLEGWMECDASGGGWGHGAGRASYVVYFRMSFSEQISDFGIWETVPAPDMLRQEQLRQAWLKQGKALKDFPAGHPPITTVWRGRTEATTRAGGFFVEFPCTEQPRPVLLKAGISFSSLEGAAAHLAGEIVDWDFDALHQRARAQWAKSLGVLSIEGGTESQRQIFHTALYRCFIDPRAISDANGVFRETNGHLLRAETYTQRSIFSGWDVFRSQMPLLTLVAPRVVDDTINSLLYVARTDNKGRLPRWEMMLRESGCMLGDPAIPVIVDAWRKGIRGFDTRLAWEAIRSTVSRDREWTERGYATGPVGLSLTLESAYADACAAWYAQEVMHKPDDAKALWRTSQNYRNVFDPSVGWMRARNGEGDWLEWQGRAVQGQGCIESNPFQQGWFVPHDVPGLITLLGHERFLKDLAEFLEHADPDFLWNDYYNHANEPVHHVPFLAVYAGAPWLTQAWTRAVLERAYRTGPWGLVGNEDLGQMSAWYVLAALGLHPVCPGDPIYIISSPLFPKATLQLDPAYTGGGQFTIKATHTDNPQAIYIQAAKLNGRPLERAWITHKEITAGGTLEVELGVTPNTSWGLIPPPPSLVTQAQPASVLDEGRAYSSPESRDTALAATNTK